MPYTSYCPNKVRSMEEKKYSEKNYATFLEIEGKRKTRTIPEFCILSSELLITLFNHQNKTKCSHD